MPSVVGNRLTLFDRARAWGPEGPLISSFNFFCIVVLNWGDKFLISSLGVTPSFLDLGLVIFFGFLAMCVTWHNIYQVYIMN